jgi:hypothetical protein
VADGIEHHHLEQRERNSNEGLDCTFVYGNWRVIYGAQTLYSGSPFHTANQPYTGPLGPTTCDYELLVPADDLFRRHDRVRAQRAGREHDLLRQRHQRAGGDDGLLARAEARPSVQLQAARLRGHERSGPRHDFL